MRSTDCGELEGGGRSSSRSGVPEFTMEKPRMKMKMQPRSPVNIDHNLNPEPYRGQAQGMV